MTLNDIAQYLSTTRGLTKADAKACADAFIEAIVDATAKGEEVSIAGFGKFTVKHSPEREGRNPANGEPMTIKATNKVSFKPAKAFKGRLNG